MEDAGAPSASTRMGPAYAPVTACMASNSSKKSGLFMNSCNMLKSKTSFSKAK